MVEAAESFETLAAVRCESEVPSRSQTPLLSASAPSTVATIVLDDKPTPPLRSGRSALLEDDEWDRAEREIMQVTRSSAVDAPAAVAANPLATSAHSTRARSACASTECVDYECAAHDCACAFAFAVVDRHVRPLRSGLRILLRSRGQTRSRMVNSRDCLRRRSKCLCCLRRWPRRRLLIQRKLSSRWRLRLRTLLSMATRVYR